VHLDLRCGTDQPPRAAELPLVLADAHRRLGVGGRLQISAHATTDLVAPTDERGCAWNREHLRRVIEAGGFAVDRLDASPGGEHGACPVEVTATAQRALPDHVAADLDLLCCGLNPSWHAADAGVGYVTGSNRFWRALAAAGRCTRDRDPDHLVRHHRIGMTDLVKRPTTRADELHADEYRAGLVRLEELCEWLRPRAVAMVGLAGWRAAVDRRAKVGWQTLPLGPSPVYVLPSTSGLNAGSTLGDLTAHLRTAADGPPGT
jgi:TDG/mug DNA glycosylase family protein